jgi:probable rRNA maturation factor
VSESPYLIDVASEQADVPVDLERAASLASHVLEAERVAIGTELSIVYVDAATMAALNERFRGSRGPTDVLSFSIDGPRPSSDRVPDGVSRSPTREEDEPPSLLGEVVICPGYAIDRAKEAGSLVAGWPEPDGLLSPSGFGGDLDLLLVHGILHLLGYDHEEEAEAEAMEERERQLLSSFWSRGGQGPQDSRGHAQGRGS